MRCFISLILGLLALEVALARSLQDQALSSVQSMCSDDSSSEDIDCINCQTNEECAQNDMCCPSSCGRNCKTPDNIDVAKAVGCPWDPFQMNPVEPCVKKNLCFSDNDCSGTMKCCNNDCVMNCMYPEPEIALQ